MATKRKPPGRISVKTHSGRTNLPRHAAPALTGAAYNLRMTKGQRSKRKPSLPKMPWEGADEPR